MSRLRPYDITKLVVALGCDLTEAKRKLYLDIVDDIFPNRSELNKLQNKECCIHVFGADLTRLQLRLNRPLYYARFFGATPLNIYVLVSSPGRSLGYTVQPRWVLTTSAYNNIKLSAYDNTCVGHTMPWIHIRPEVIENILGKHFLHTTLLQPIQQQLVPCIRIQGGSQRSILLYGDSKPRYWMESNLLNRQARRNYPGINFIMAPCWKHSFFMLHIA